MRAEPRADESHAESQRSLLADIQSLGALREELRLQAHLFRAEARERFELLERSWIEVERVARAIEHESAEAAKRLAQTGREMTGALKTEYRRLKGDVTRRG